MFARRIVRDQRGFIISIELILISTICVIGLIAGWTAVRDAVVSELSDVAGAMQTVNQSVSFADGAGSSAGSFFVDTLDHCDDNIDPVGAADNCIVFSDPPSNEGA